MHLGDPVPQAVHDQLEHVRVAHVQAVARAGVVDVAAPVLGAQAVVGRVVGALQGEHRSAVVSLRGVVVDDVEDDLDALPVQRLHHLLELLHLLTLLAVHRVRTVRGQVGDGVVAPVVAQAELVEPVVVHELVHRHQLHRGDTEGLQMVEHRLAAQAEVGAPDLRRDVGVGRADALHVGLVDDRVVPRGAGMAIVGPVEERADHHRLGHERSRVAGGGLAVGPVGEGVAEHGLGPLDLAVDRLGVGVDEELVGVAAAAFLRRPRAVDAESVPLTGLDARHVPVVDVGRDQGKGQRGSRGRRRRRGTPRRIRPPPRTGRSWCRCRRRSRRGGTVRQARSPSAAA